MEMLSLTDFILSKKYNLSTLRAKGVKMTKGGCLCGKITFEFSSVPVKKLLCHCTNCKRLTGTAYSTNITIPSRSLRFVGSPRQFVFNSGQGPISTISFCGMCSSTLWKESDAEERKGYILVQAGALAQECDGHPPDAEIFTKERTKWVAAMDGVKQFENTDASFSR